MYYVYKNFYYWNTFYSFLSLFYLLFIIIFIYVISVPNETKKDVRFSTRHTCNGALSHVDGSAVSACGFLPQDMIGRNVFDFYHPEDLPLLQEIYQEVVEKGRAVGTSFRSKPYR